MFVDRERGLGLPQISFPRGAAAIGGSRDRCRFCVILQLSLDPSMAAAEKLKPILRQKKRPNSVDEMNLNIGRWGTW